jgi:hypothetical protein
MDCLKVTVGGVLLGGSGFFVSKKHFATNLVDAVGVNVVVLFPKEMKNFGVVYVALFFKNPANNLADIRVAFVCPIFDRLGWISGTIPTTNHGKIVKLRHFPYSCKTTLSLIRGVFYLSLDTILGISFTLMEMIYAYLSEMQSPVSQSRRHQWRETQPIKPQVLP